VTIGRLICPSSSAGEGLTDAEIDVDKDLLIEDEGVGDADAEIDDDADAEIEDDAI
jgi:hypothetical protein